MNLIRLNTVNFNPDFAVVLSLNRSSIANSGFNPNHALEILLHLETASISSVSSILFLEMIITIPSS